jgi:hypothetical protein
MQIMSPLAYHNRIHYRIFRLGRVPRALGEALNALGKKSIGKAALPSAFCRAIGKAALPSVGVPDTRQSWKRKKPKKIEFFFDKSRHFSRKIRG